MNPGTYVITNRWGLFAAGLNRHLNARTHVRLDNITTRGANHDFHSLHFSVPATGETGYFMFQAADPASHIRNNFFQIGT